MFRRAISWILPLQLLLLAACSQQGDKRTEPFLADGSPSDVQNRLRDIDVLAGWHEGRGYGFTVESVEISEPQFESLTWSVMDAKGEAVRLVAKLHPLGEEGTDIDFEVLVPGAPGTMVPAPLENLSGLLFRSNFRERIESELNGRPFNSVIADEATAREYAMTSPAFQDANPKWTEIYRPLMKDVVKTASKPRELPKMLR